jgi:membrane-associated phospholipid phosphatase
MSARLHRAAHGVVALAAIALLGACQDPVSVPDHPSFSANGQPIASAALKAPATLAWNQVARDLIAKHLTSAPASIRTLALLSVAQYNAIAEAEQDRPAGPNKATGHPLRPSAQGAIAGASAAVLAYVYPQEATSLTALAAEQRAAASGPRYKGHSFAAGEDIGRAVAEGLIARAQTDRYFAPFTGTVPACSGCWVAVPTPPAFATLGQAKPYFLRSGDQFRPPPPPAFDSPAFRTALAEVRQIADTRTAEQDSIARFWALPLGTVGAQGYLNEVAAELAARYRRSERETAHALALLNMAAYDAIVASHEAKYHYWLIRPSQADPQIVRAIGMPSFPAYPSNHATLVATAATVLGELFPGARAKLDAMAEEGALSRVYGGIHYRFDVEAGLALGRQVGVWTLEHDVARGTPFVLR